MRQNVPIRTIVRRTGGRARPSRARQTALYAGAIWILVAVAVRAQVPDGGFVRYVDPMIGTGGHGHTYPGATVPFGMVQLSPDAGKHGWDWCSGYHYGDSSLIGFGHTHLSGTGCADLGDILLRPAISFRAFDRSYRAPFSHAHEHAEPGYYSVDLLDSRIRVELTATLRTGMHRYTFPHTDSAMVLLDLGYGQDDHATECGLTVVRPDLVTGWRFSKGWAARQRVYFAMQFSAPFAWHRVHADDRWDSNELAYKAGDVFAAFFFGRRSDDPLLVKVGISAVSADGALRNLEVEAPEWNFDAVRAAARGAWERALDVCAVSARDTSILRTFYTALYHCFLAPTVYEDVDGAYRGGDDRVHRASGFENYTTFSLWDTFRALHPLLTILQPRRVPSIVRSLLAFQHETGLLPVWTLHANETNCMIGYHAVPVIADAILKGFGGFDVRQAFAAMRASAEQTRGGFPFYTGSGGTALADALASNRLPDPADFDQPAWPERAVYVGGYGRRVSGDTIVYHSSHPRANEALIVRATDGKSRIAWDTEPVPAVVSEDAVVFVWLGGMCANRGSRSFRLSADGVPVLDISGPDSPERRTIVARGEHGAVFRFEAVTKDEFGDLFGNMTLVLPRAMVHPGTPLRLEIDGMRENSTAWMMTFAYRLHDGIAFRNGFVTARDRGGTFQFIVAHVENLDQPKMLRVRPKGARPVNVLALPGSHDYRIPVRTVAARTRTVLEYAFGSRSPSRVVWFLYPPAAAGYIPADVENESVSKTLEYAFDDWCIARTAEKLGRHDDARRYDARARNYRTLFDPSVSFMRGRTRDGAWVEPFDPRFSTLKQREYTEGNAWEYTWFVPQDVEGLVGLMGGPRAFESKLDSLFSQNADLAGTGATEDLSGLIGLYAHGNEPSHHIAYLYDYVDRPQKTQALVRRILKEFYTDKPDGLCGNEDCGQMSAWYVLSALGFYPVNPASGVYALGAPIVDRATISLPGGKTFTIVAGNDAVKNPYVAEARMDGVRLTEPFIRHDQIVHGGELRFVLTPTSENGFSGH